MNSKKRGKVNRRIKAVLQDYDFNEMKVYGNRDQLKTFMVDVHGEGKSVFCLDKIFDMSEITRDRVKEPFPGLVIYRSIYSRNRFPDSNAVLSDEIEYLKYSFDSYYADTHLFYEILMNKYPELQFKIFIKDCDDFIRYEIEIKDADYEKYFFYYVEKIPWRENSTKLMLYKDDQLKNTLQVVEEEITFPEFDIREPVTLNDDLLEDLPPWER
jgi:hypothetical protein